MKNIYVRCKKKFAIFIEIDSRLGWSPIKIGDTTFGEKIIDMPYMRIIFTPLNQKQTNKR